MPKTNYHAHTTWCDGRDTPRAMAEAALAAGFSAFGFSSHAMFPDSASHTLDPARAADYVADVRAVADAFRGRLDVWCSLEADYVPGRTDPDRARYAAYGLDYLIGSVHYVVAADGTPLEVDHTPEILAEGLRAHFDGDARMLIGAYHRQLREMVASFDFDIVGHCDLYRKYNLKHPLFDERAGWYLGELEASADAIAASGKVVEVNTGAIGRGWRDDAYPSDAFRDLLRARGVRFVLDSDCHAADQLEAGYAKYAAAESYVDFNPQTRRFE